MARLMIVGKLCLGCGAFIDRPAGSQGYCDGCRPDTNRSKRRAIYDDPRWRRTRQIVVRRDARQCRLCGRHQSELEDGELLVIDHWPLPVLEAPDPFDPAGCRVLCSTCSGGADGSRRPD